MSFLLLSALIIVPFSLLLWVIVIIFIVNNRYVMLLFNQNCTKFCFSCFWICCYRYHMFIAVFPYFSRFVLGYSNFNSNSLKFCGIYNFEEILTQFYWSAISRVLSIEGLQNLSDKTCWSLIVALLPSFGKYL